MLSPKHKTRILKSMKRFIQLFNLVLGQKNILITLFFVFLGISLFLGDGKQPLVDIFAGINIVCLAVFTLLTQEKKRNIPSKIQTAWVLLIGYFVFRTIFSDSVGYSISTTLRLCMGYVIFYLFYSFFDKKQLYSFTRALLLFCATTTVLSFTIHFFFPRVIIGLPAMNLLYAAYGHNHLASLLLITLPIILYEIQRKRSWLNIGIFFLIVGGLTFSFGRGIYILLVAFFTILFFKQRLMFNFKSKLTYIILTLFFCAALVIPLIFFRNAATSQDQSKDWFNRQLVKSEFSIKPRLYYWNQALAGFSNSPFFGSGPGTFYQTSKRFQKVPNSYSYFAHNFFLETLSETGLGGTVLLLTLMSVLFTTIWRNLKQDVINVSRLYIPLALGLTLTTIYSFFDFSLNFLIIWLIFWAICGILSPTQNTTPTKRSLHKFLGLCLVCMLFLSLSWGTALVLSNSQNPFLKSWMFYLAPYDAQFVLKYLNDQTSDGSRKTATYIAYFFHKKNPEILTAIINQNPKLDTSLKKQILTDLIQADKYRWENYERSLQFSILQNDQKETAHIIEETLKNFFSEKINLDEHKLYLKEPGILMSFTSTTAESLYKHQDFETFAMKLYYLFGKSYLSTNTTRTEYFWRLAYKMHPQLGLLHAELAALNFYLLGDKTEAQNLISECRTLVEPKMHCSQLLPNLSNLTRPGDLEHYVLRH